jgi:hypothetical protein
VSVHTVTFLYSKMRRVYAIAQAVSRRLPTAAARVPAQVKSCEIFGVKSGTGAGFFRLLRFPLPIIIPPDVLHSSTFRGWQKKND